MTDTTHPHPEPSEEASSLPVVAWSGIDGRWLRQERSAVSNRALTYHADAQSQLNAMRVEVEKANEARRTAQVEAVELKTRIAESGVKFRREHAKELAALKAAPVVDVERIMALADEMVVAKAKAEHANQFGSINKWKLWSEAYDAAREALRASLASPEGRQK